MTLETQTPHEPASPLRRPKGDRMVAGVAAGLAERAEIPTWVVRLAFVLAALSGGFGVVVYAAGWLLIPEEGSEESHANRLFGRVEGPAAWIGLILIGIAILVLIDSVGFVRGDLGIAAVLIVAGVLLFRGDMGRRSTNTTKREHMTTATKTPIEPSPQVPRPPKPPSHLGRITIAAIFIGLGGMALADQLSSAFDPTARHYLGATMAILGIGLLVGAFFGRARWLIVIGVLLIPTMLVAAVADLTIDGGIGERRFTPTTPSAMSDEYRLAIGDLTVDLSDLQLNGSTVEFDARIGIGQLTVIAPEDAALDITARAGIGEVNLLGRTRSGVGVANSVTAAGDSGTIRMNLRGNIGEVRVTYDRTTAAASGTRFGSTVVVVDEADLESSYSIDIGDFTLDLSALELTSPRRVTVSADTGSIKVILPGQTGVQVNAQVAVGELDLVGQRTSGIGVSDEYRSGERILLELDIEMGAGKINVEGRR